MMAKSIPYVVSTGLIPRVLTKIQEARRPERFTQDFLFTKLGLSGGSAAALIPLLKRIGLLGSDGSPTSLYDEFRNPDRQGPAMAQALRIGFKDLFDVNEYAQDLSKDKLTSLVVQITGDEKDSRVVQATVATFLNLKEFANFDGPTTGKDVAVERIDMHADSMKTAKSDASAPQSPDSVDLKLSYTINLNLPETTNPDVFNAIFKALREHLLKA